MNSLATFLCQLKGSREELLFFKAKELLRCEFVLTCSVQESKVENYDVMLMSVGSAEDSCQIIQCVVVAYHDQDVSRPYAKCFRSKIFTRFQIELVQLRVLCRTFPSHSLRGGENGKEDDCECNARESCNLLSEQVDDA